MYSNVVSESEDSNLEINDYRPSVVFGVLNFTRYKNGMTRL